MEIHNSRMANEVMRQCVLAYDPQLARFGGNEPTTYPYSKWCAFSLEQDLACKMCASLNVQELTGELSASFPDIRRANLPPLYVCKEIVVCLDCGFTELVIPAPELERLKKGKAASA
jgi:hypothetical protein